VPFRAGDVGPVSSAKSVHPARPSTGGPNRPRVAATQVPLSSSFPPFPVSSPINEAVMSRYEPELVAAEAPVALEPEDQHLSGAAAAAGQAVRSKRSGMVSGAPMRSAAMP
jgi:hypothetical protein